MLAATIIPVALLWLIIAWACGLRARYKGYSFWMGFAFALLLSPLTALIALALLPFRDHPGSTSPIASERSQTTDEKGIAAIAAAYKARQERTPGRRAPPRDA